MSQPEKTGASMPVERGSPVSLPPSKPSPTRPALSVTVVLTMVFLALGFFSPARGNPRLAWTFVGVAGFLLCWQGALFLSPRRRAAGFAWEFVPIRSHYMQALAQASVYVYWGWYWRNVYAEASLILAQVVFLYIFDALVTWSRGQSWRTGFGPWPIILSTNLFMWFRDDWFVFQFLMIALGVLGKQFIRWQRGGKTTHIFNPSALGLTVVSLVLIFTGTSGYTWGQQIATTQGRPPHLYTEIFLTGLVLQYFFSVTLLTFSAAAMIGLFSIIYTQATGVYLFFDSNIPIAVFLGLHLLMTDPATTPRSDLGKAIFGCLYGAGVFGAVFVLDAIGAPTFYDKLVIVPVLNLMTPWLDRLAAAGAAGKFGRWEVATGLRKMNLAFMGGWVALFVTMKASGFVEGPHPGRTIGFWEKAAEENRPKALKNLRYIVNQFTLHGMDDTPEGAYGVSSSGRMSREQALGILCDQVATIYAQGKFVPANSGEAAHFFERACELGNADGCAHFALAYVQSSNAVAGQAEASQAFSTLEQSGDAQKSGPICCLLAYAYNTGRGRPVDKAKARMLYEKGAALGEMAGWKALAQMELTGEGGAPDHAAAAGWLQKAADAKDGQSCLYLARMYHNGDGVARDEQKANDMLEQACGLGIQGACDLLKAVRK